MTGSTGPTGIDLAEETLRVARDLIRIDTSNAPAEHLGRPPGEETLAAEYLHGYLTGHGVECELVARDERRANLVARIPGSGDAPSLAFVGHTDVVPADARDWTHPPFAAVVTDDGWLHGRGAVDMKGEVAARAVAMAALARSGFRPRGDLWLLAVADEEDGMYDVGMRWLLEERPDIRPAMAVNEGGGERLPLTDGRVVVPVGVGEGHLPRAGQRRRRGRPRVDAVDRPQRRAAAREVLRRVGAGMPAAQPSPLLERTLEVLLGSVPADLAEGAERAGRLHPALAHLLPALTGTTMAPTMVGGSSKRNVMPARAWVELDCRILPGTTADEVERAVRDRLGHDLPYELDWPEHLVAGSSSPESLPADGRHRGDDGGGGAGRAGRVARGAGRAAPAARHRVHRLRLPARRGRHHGVRLQPLRAHPGRRAGGRLPQRRRAHPRRRPGPVGPVPRRARATGARVSAAGSVMTVRGPVAADALGVVLPHEHLFSDLLVEYRAAGLLDDEALAVQELGRYAAAGGGTLVDLTTDEIGRDPAALRRVSEATGVHVVMGCGHYRDPYLDRAWFDRTSVDEIAAAMVAEITDGVGPERVRPGIIGEIGCDQGHLSAAEERSFRAAARAHLATGLTISTHAARRPVGLDQLAVLEHEGVDPRRVVVGHCDTVPRPAYHLELARSGCFVQLDGFGSDGGHYEDRALGYLEALAEAGHLRQLLLSHDVFLPQHLHAHGGTGYDHLLVEVVPRLRQRGFTDDDLHTLLVDNPRRALTGEP
ncbi:M20/M25/M40 family metallo-hydrolase [Nocardioides sp. TF02-7]|uniref:phosphotriesterase family protein n=1 Tax=Nocardioides sp. TF02-7 TaxID=2917724 RepID=UPI001F058885|nr:M20/M25/M40 family metallo-hydrolase [Nocardioides sp. TF02-7]UMG93497.1 M20/M25/M40 family metallo-hydrolase [Nocardioides sp. TF02-7]